MAEYLNKTGLQYFYTKISALFATKTELSNWDPGVAAQYPVGAIYMSTSSTNPSTYFGGTWELWGAGRTPVSVDVDDTSSSWIYFDTEEHFDTVEKTGGAKTDTLYVGEVPAHTHTYTYMTTTTTGQGASGNTNKYRVSSRPTNDTSTTPETTTPHNNLQPYQVCYIWKKTAA